jgi:hypothetical protein
MSSEKGADYFSLSTKKAASPFIQSRTKAYSMRLMIEVIVWLTLLTGAGRAFALDYLNAAMQNQVRLAPKSYAGGLYKLLGEELVDSKWHVAQWGILQELPNATDCLGTCTDGTWQTANKHGYVRLARTLNLGQTVELKQDSTEVGYACTEYDLFLEPNGLTAYPGYAAAVVPEDGLPSLGTVTNFHVQVLQQVVSARHGTRCPPPYNLATTVIGLVFHNRWSGEGFFYQIITYDSREFQFDGTWFARTAPYGVNDDIFTNYAQSRLVPGGLGVFYDIDIAARLRELIEAPSSPVVDKDMNHWKFVGAYFGSMVNGEAVITSRVSLIRVFTEAPESPA